MNRKTRYKDKDGQSIYIGDIIYVNEYPDKYVGGSYSYEGVVEIENGKVVCVYYDLGEREALSLSFFKKKGRELLTEEQQRRYWKTALLGAEPPESLWKRNLYRNTPVPEEDAEDY